MLKWASLLVIALLLVPAMKVRAMEAEPAPMIDPVPETWREPFSHFLKDLGATDVEATVGNSRTAEFRGSVFDTMPKRRIFRIIRSDTCGADEDQCLTVIGHLDGTELKADALFYAGNRMNQGDHEIRILGVDRAARLVKLWSKNSITSVVETAKGLLVVSQQIAPGR